MQEDGGARAVALLSSQRMYRELSPEGGRGRTFTFTNSSWFQAGQAGWSCAVPASEYWVWRAGRPSYKRGLLGRLS
eukprot:5926276-Amphidinium_carterae.2